MSSTGLAARILLLTAALGLAAAADPWPRLTAAAGRPPAEARKELEALLLEQPDFLPAHFNLGTLLLDSDPDTAVSHLERAAGSPLADLSADAWSNLALARYRQGRLDEALTAAIHACERRPDGAAKALRDELRRVLVVRHDEARRRAEEEAKKLHLALRSLPDAHVGEAYDQHLQAIGGAGGYRFTLGAPPANAAAANAAPAPAAPPPPALPPGLALESDGRVHGTPTAAGATAIPVVVQDAARTSISAGIALTVIPAPAITTRALPEAILAQDYAAGLSSVGLEAPRWRISGLPGGLAVGTARAATATISGQPLRAGTVTVHVVAEDGARSAVADLPLTVSDAFAPDAAVLPPATAWQAYSHKLGVRGPVQAYRWSAAPAAGLTISADGAVGGTPEQAGEQALAVTIAAADGRSRTSTVTVPVNPPPVIEEPQPIELTRGAPVVRPLALSGGTAPFTWTLAEGTLPKGLRLDGDGTLRGAVGEPAKAEVTVAATDRWQAATRQKVTIIVKEADSKDQDQQQEPPKRDKDQDQAKQEPKDGQQKQDGKDGKDGKDPQQEGKDGKQDGTDGKQAQQDAKKPGDDAKKPDPQAGGKDQKPDDAKPRDQGKDQTAQQPGQQPGAQDKLGGGTDKDKDKDHAQDQTAAATAGGAPAANDPAHDLKQAAADRWLDQLPKENRGALRVQLLDGSGARVQKGKAW